MPGLRGSAAPGLRTDEVWRHIARENTKAKATNDTLRGCDQCSTGYGRAQEPHGCASESPARGVPGGRRMGRRAFELPILADMPGVAMEDDHGAPHDANRALGAHGACWLGDQPAEFLRRRPRAESSADRLFDRCPLREIKQAVLKQVDQRQKSQAAGCDPQRGAHGSHRPHGRLSHSMPWLGAWAAEGGEASPILPRLGCLQYSAEYRALQPSPGPRTYTTRWDMIDATPVPLRVGRPCQRGAGGASGCSLKPTGV